MQYKNSLFFKFFMELNVEKNFLYKLGCFIYLKSSYRESDEDKEFELFKQLGIKEFINYLFDPYYRNICYKGNDNGFVSLEKFIQNKMKTELSISKIKGFSKSNKTIEMKSFISEYNSYEKRLKKFTKRFKFNNEIINIPLITGKYEFILPYIEKIENIFFDINDIKEEMNAIKITQINKPLCKNRLYKVEHKNNIYKKKIEEKNSEIKEIVSIIKNKNLIKYSPQNNEIKISKEGSEDIIFIFEELGRDISNIFSGRSDLITDKKIEIVMEKTEKFFIDKKGNSKMQAKSRVLDIFGQYLEGVKRYPAFLFYDLENYLRLFNDIFLEWTYGLSEKEKWNKLEEERKLFEQIISIEQHRIEII